MSRPCDCRNAAPGPFAPGQCWKCWLALNTAEYGPAWGGAMPANPLPIPRFGGGRPKAAPRPACRHLGPPTGGAVECPTCSGKVSLKLFACAVYEVCTPGKAAPGVANCPGCPSYSPGDL